MRGLSCIVLCSCACATVLGSTGIQVQIIDYTTCFCPLHGGGYGVTEGPHAGGGSDLISAHVNRRDGESHKVLCVSGNLETVGWRERESHTNSSRCVCACVWACARAHSKFEKKTSFVEHPEKVLFEIGQLSCLLLTVKVHRVPFFVKFDSKQMDTPRSTGSCKLNTVLQDIEFG